VHVAARTIFPQLNALGVIFLVFGGCVKMPAIVLDARQPDDYSCTFFHKKNPQCQYALLDTDLGK
jgi:hypothetical protein